jgi:LysM repeat protein
LSCKIIDISHHQKSVDFSRVKAAGISGVIVKATEGVQYVDPAFHTHAKGAVAAGLPVGAYHLIRATPIGQQARDFLAAVKQYKLQMVAIDVENPSATSDEISRLGKAEITRRVIALAQLIRTAGYKQIYVYASKSWLDNYLDVAALKAAGLKIWLAWYSAATPDNTDRSGLCDIWQYADNGTVDGISGPVDVDVAYRGFGATQAAPTVKPAAASSATTYTVRAGDTLSSIAARFGTTYQQLAKINGIANPNLIHVGQVIRLTGSAPAAAAKPVSGMSTYTVRSGDTLSGIAAKYHTTYQELARINGISNPNLIHVGQVLKISGGAAAAASAAQYYTIVRGDTLSKIAARFGTTYQQLAKINGIANPSLIYAGQRIRIK